MNMNLCMIFITYRLTFIQTADNFDHSELHSETKQAMAEMSLGVPWTTNVSLYLDPQF